MSQKKAKKLRSLAKKEDKAVVLAGLSFLRLLKEDWLFLFILVIGVVAVYANGMMADFVSDDYAGITQNPFIKDLVFNIKTTSVPATLNTVVAIIFGIDSPTPFHLLSLLLYLGTCILVYIFLRLIFDKEISRLAVVLFAFHPVHVESVTWISGKPYLLTTFLVLTALIFSYFYYVNRKGKYLWLVLLVGFFAFFNDRVRGFSFFLIAVLYLISFSERIRIRFDQSLWRAIAVLLTALVIIFVLSYDMIMSRINIVNSGYNASENVFYNPLFQYPTAISKYLQLLLAPLDLTLYHTMYVFPIWLMWMISLTYLGCLVYFYVKNKGIFFALAFIFVATAPSMLPVKVSWLVAERYVFFGSIGYCLFLAIVLIKIKIKSLFLYPVLLTVIILFYLLRLYTRNVDWQTNHKLWVSTCQVSPNSHNAWNNIGDDYDKLKQYENAIKGFTQSTVVKPNYADAFHNRANIFFKTGRLDLARDSYETALRFSQALHQTYISLIQIDLMEKKYDLAGFHAQKLLQLQPNNPQAWFIKAVVLAQTGNITGAKEALENSLRIDPNFKQSKDMMTQLSLESG